MNLTSQIVQNQKTKHACLDSRMTTNTVHRSVNKVRLNSQKMSLNAPIRSFDKKSFKVKNIYFNMILCPIGEFIVGIYNPDNPNPKKEKISEPYFLGETEITQEVYQAVMLKNPSSAVNLKRAVNNVSWYDAIVFCNKLSEMQGMKPYYIISNISNYDYDRTKIRSAVVKQDLKSNGFRLPFESEWEYAAKAGTNNKYAGCDDTNLLTQYARFKENVKNGIPCRVKTRKANEWGFYDMTGNVSEWTWSFKMRFFTGRVIRGGSFESDPDFSLRTDYRTGESEDTTKSTIGFRIAMSVNY